MIIPSFQHPSQILRSVQAEKAKSQRRKSEGRAKALAATYDCCLSSLMWPATGISEDPFETPSIAFRDKSIQLFLGKGTSFSSVTLCYVTITGARNVTQCYAEKMCQNPNREESTCLVCFS